MPPPVKVIPGQDDAPFNMAQLFYFRLNELLANKSRAKLSNDLNTWFIALSEIHTQISFKLQDGENKDICAILEKIRSYLSTPRPNNNKLAAQIDSIVYSRVYSWLQDLDTLLMRKMDHYKMIFPRIETRSNMKQLRDQLGLQDPPDD